VPYDYYIITNYNTNGVPIGGTLTNLWENAPAIYYTNKMTNVFGNTPNWDMFDRLRSPYNNSIINTHILRALIPNFADTNTIGDGKVLTNLSVMVLFKALEIGNYHQKTILTNVASGVTNVYTNNGMEFTWSPGWTNVVANYPICYTQIYAQLNYDHTTTEDYTSNNVRYLTYRYCWTTQELLTVQSYTSTVAQTVNYTPAYTTSEYLVYQNVTTACVESIYSLRLDYIYTNRLFNSYTNQTVIKDTRYFSDAEDYGLRPDWYTENITPGTIYPVYLEEMYKALNALEYTISVFSTTGFSRTLTMGVYGTNMQGLDDLKSKIAAAFTNAVVARSDTPQSYILITRGGSAPSNISWNIQLYRSYGSWRGYLSHDVEHENPKAWAIAVPEYNVIFDPQGDNILYTNKYSMPTQSFTNFGETYVFTIGDSNLPAPPNWPPTPTSNSTVMMGYTALGAKNGKVTTRWKPIYCTNQYWVTNSVLD
jgi:hypothetical protein